ncbi:MAG: hypothetical protein ACP5JB_02780 [candidate division WOR-3 bacterium]
MKKLLTLSAVVCAVVLARTTAGGYGAFGPTLAIVNYDSINNTFQHFGINKLAAQHWTFGGGGYLLANRMLIGGAGWGGNQTVTSESLNLFCQVSYGGGEFRAGYALLDSRYLLLVPGLGIGGGGYSINLGPYNQTLPSFDSLLAHPGRTSTVNFSGFTLNPQLAIIVPISFVGLELRGGYNFGPLGGNWELQDRGVLARGPQMSKANPWFSLNIIFGGFNRKKTKLSGRIEIEGGAEPEETPPPSAPEQEEKE